MENKGSHIWATLKHVWEEKTEEIMHMAGDKGKWRSIIINFLLDEVPGRERP